MNDLISRNELEKEIKGIYLHYSGVRSGKGILAQCMDSYKELVLKIIAEQPTAYSVDKVVEELEERTDFLKDCTKYGNKNAKQQAESYSTMMMYEVADLIDDLIEIVKQGGVANDVCEWRIVDRPHNLPIYNTSCGKIKMQYTTGVDIYCNGCGKKIKVVE